jgi:hypothetical protein
MINIIHRKDPAGMTAPIVYNVKPGINVLGWLKDTFTSQHELSGELACSFILNGKEIFRSDHDSPDESRLDFTLGKIDQLIIINRPAGFDPVTVMIALTVASLVASVAAFLMMPKLPGAEEARQESPNNRLNAATNEFRPGQGIPECFGYGVSYPDFIQPSYYFYENNIKKQIGVFCISAGEVAIDEVRVGDTNINDIPESSAQVFTPGNRPDDEFLTIHQSAANVDGQVLVAPDDETVLKIGLSFTMTETLGTITLTTTDEVVQDLNLESGGYIYLRSTYEAANPTPPPATITTYALDGVFKITSLTVIGSVATVTFNATYAGLPDVSGSIGRGDPTGAIGEGTLGTTDTWIGWFDTPGLAAEEVFVHWQAPTGVRGSSGNKITLSIEIQIENIDEPLQSFSKVTSITDNTFDPQFITTKLTSVEFPTMTEGQWRVRARRITQVVNPSGTASEQLKLEAFVSVSPYSVTDFGDVTTLLVQRRATLFSPDQSGQKINCDYRRKLPYYNRVTNTYETGNLQPTQSFADAVAYTLIARGNETEQTVDLQELYDINDDLFDQRLGWFTFTFNDADLSKGERIESICSAARVASFHDGRQWRFSRDEVKPIAAAAFNRRSVVGNNAGQSWQPQRDDDADSVRIIYVDPLTNTEEREERMFDIGTGTIISGEIGLIPIEIKLAGCRNQYQASNRADLEIRRIAYQRRSVKETAYRDALEVGLLDRVRWIDINDIDTFDGEITGFDVISSDAKYDTTERFLPESGKSYVVFITDSNGYPSNTVTCLPRDDTEFGFVAQAFVGAYVADGDKQIGSRYFIADADDMQASNFTLRSREPNQDGTVGIELVDYNELMYERDEDAPPLYQPYIASGLEAVETVAAGNDAISELSIKTDGSISLNGVPDTWYSGGVTAGIGTQFEVYFSILSEIGGGLNGGLANAWEPITLNRNANTFRLSTDGPGTDAVVLKVQIREIANTQNRYTNSITIRSVIE